MVCRATSLRSWSLPMIVGVNGREPETACKIINKEHSRFWLYLRHSPDLGQSLPMIVGVDGIEPETACKIINKGHSRFWLSPRHSPDLGQSLPRIVGVSKTVF
jgi:hypothetical protein